MAGDTKGLVVTSQHKGDSFTITTYIPPRRNGGPNVGAYGAAMAALATVEPDAFDPDEVPAALQPVMPSLAASEPAQTLIPAHIAEAMLRDGAVPPDDDEGSPYPIPGCATGGCSGE